MGGVPMSGRHQPENGADSEPVSAEDRTCDYCARVQYSGPLRQVAMAHSISWLCEACYQRQQQRYEEAVA
jgi:hypothetical protein